MKQWFNKIRMDRMINAAVVYVKHTYKKYDVTTPTIYIKDFHSPSSSKSTDGDSTKTVSGAGIGPRYSLSDNYDGESIDKAVSSISESRSASNMLKSAKAIGENLDMSFADKMLEYINSKHMSNADVYKAADIDRRLFSKIISHNTYKPSRDTCIALAFALKLNLRQANDLLARAGFTLSHSNKRDVIIEFFFKKKIYDLSDINTVLFSMDQKTIGR